MHLNCFIHSRHCEPPTVVKQSSEPKAHIFWIASLAFAMTIMLAAVPAQAQERQPGDACTTAGHYTRSGGVEIPGGHFMVCDGTAWRSIFSYDNDRNVGVGVTAPAAKLHVDGAVILGAASAVSCTGARAGGLRYSAVNNCLELCDGAAWACISVGACGNAMPNAFNFTDLINQTVSTLVESNILQITGLGCTVNIAISGAGSPQYRICSTADCSSVIADWTAATGTIENNNYLQLRLTTSAAGGDTRSATVYTGNFAEVWNAQTEGDCTGSPAPGTICPDGTVYAGQSPDGGVPMFVPRCDAGQSWDGVACTGTALLLSWNDGFSNWVSVSTGASAGKANTATLVVTDSNSVQPGVQPHIAAQYCDDLNHGGHTDWYLPARNELAVMYINRAAIGGLNISGSNYWSSSQDNTNSAWRRRFSDGDEYGNNKNYTFLVRCARR